MAIGGLWHGAGWGFLLWGLLHGFFLCINHAWRYFKKKLGILCNSFSYKYLCLVLTFLSVTVAWVPFRAATMDGCLSFFYGMVGLNGVVIPDAYAHYFVWANPYLEKLGVTFGATPGFFGFFQILLLLVLLIVVWFLPNSNEYIKANGSVSAQSDAKELTLFRWNASLIHACLIGFTLAIALISITELSEFLYFQF